MSGAREITDSERGWHTDRVCTLPLGESQASKNAIDSPARAALKVIAPAHPAMSRREKLMAQKLSGIIAEHVRAINAFDTEAVVATFAKDAYVNDVQREIVGIDAI